LKKAISKVKTDDSEESTGLLDQLKNTAKVQAERSLDDIYQEVVMDEVNDELMKSIQKAEGEIIVVLLRQERLKSFEKLWMDANMDFYQTQQNKRMSERLNK